MTQHQFDVFPTGLPDTPYVVSIQSDFLTPLATRLVIPIRPATSPLGILPLSKLTPTVTIHNQPFVLDTPRLAAVNAAELTQHITSLQEQRQVILDAVDFLLHGY